MNRCILLMMVLMTLSCKEIAISSEASNAHSIAKNIILIEKQVKNHIKPNMLFKEMYGLLGNPHQALGFGVTHYIWYFDDDTCLAVLYAGEENVSETKWIKKCKPGEFKLHMLKNAIVA